MVRAPDVWAVGVPVLPEAVPGAALSPGTSNCSLARAPALTGVEGLVLAVLVPSVASVAVTVETAHSVARVFRHEDTVRTGLDVHLTAAAAQVADDLLEADKRAAQDEQDVGA